MICSCSKEYFVFVLNPGRCSKRFYYYYISQHKDRTSRNMSPYFCLAITFLHKRDAETRYGESANEWKGAVFTW